MQTEIRRVHGYVIRDAHADRTISKRYQSGKRARTRAEKLNLEYGAHRYHVVTIYDLGGGVYA